MAVRAKIWSTVFIDPKGRPRRSWHYAVFNSAGEVVLYDDTGYFAPILRSALIRVTALRHMEIAGHRLRPYTGYHYPVPPKGRN